MDELLQKHRTFTLSVAVGGVVFLLALMLRGCAVYKTNLDGARAVVERKSKELTATPVPDDRYLRDMDRVVEAADARVAELAREVGRTARGEDLWEECIRDTLKVIGKDSEATRRDLMARSRTLPTAAFSRLLDQVRTVLVERAAQGDVEIGSQDLGFDQVQEANFGRSLAALAAVVRVVDRCIALGVQRVESIAVHGSAQGSGGAPDDPFLVIQNVRFKLRGDPAVLAEVVKSLNDRDDGGTGRRIVLDEVLGLGRPMTVKAGEPGNTEFIVRVYLVNLEAKEEPKP